MNEATIDVLKQQVEELSKENSKLRKERDWAWARVMASVPAATAEEEKAFLQEIQSAGPGGELSQLIAELEAVNGR